MDQESKEMLERTLELAEENNKMLHSMRRSMQIARIMSFLYWAVIIGSAIGAYYFIEPYLQQVISVYQSAGETLDSIKSFGL